MEDDVDLLRKPHQRLVHGVVDDFPETVHEASAVRRADVHAGALADGIQTLEHREMLGGVVRSCFRARHRRPFGVGSRIDKVR